MPLPSSRRKPKRGVRSGTWNHHQQLDRIHRKLCLWRVQVTVVDVSAVTTCTECVAPLLFACLAAAAAVGGLLLLDRHEPTAWAWLLFSSSRGEWEPWWPRVNNTFVLRLISGTERWRTMRFGPHSGQNGGATHAQHVYRADDTPQSPKCTSLHNPSSPSFGPTRWVAATVEATSVIGRLVQNWPFAIIRPCSPVTNKRCALALYGAPKRAIWS